jgi:hypothetical protein
MCFPVTIQSTLIRFCTDMNALNNSLATFHQWTLLFHKSENVRFSSYRMMFKMAYHEVIMLQLASQVHSHSDSGNAVVLEINIMAPISHWQNNKNVPSTHYDHSGCIAMHV